jgi:hypothetical protein
LRSAKRGDVLQLRVESDQVAQLLGGHPASGLAGDVSRSDGGEHRLGPQGRVVSLALTWDQLGKQPLEPVHRLDAWVGQLVATVQSGVAHPIVIPTYAK